MSNSAGRKPKLSRRDFARKAALTAATAAVLPGELLARSLAPASPQAPAQQTKLSPESQAEADAMFQAILRQHGDRFSEAQKTDLRRLANEGQKPLEALRAFPLDNSDQPGNVLKVYPDPRVVARASNHTRG
jgi:hypothetical protein